MTGQTNKDKREVIRFKVPMDVRLIDAHNQSYSLKTRDISDTGVFLVCDDTSQLPVGSEVRLQVLDALADSPAPEVKARIVRIDDDGIGLRFLNTD